MKISNYVPDIYIINIEFNNIINSEEVEFENLLKKQIRKSFENNFIKLADLDGIKRFETLFNIKPDEANEDLEFRRQRLFNRLTSKPPFTERFLQNKLDEIMKPGNWRYDIVYNDYTLDIYALRPGKLWLTELMNLLEIIMPCNILWTIHIYSIIWQAVLDNTESWNDITSMTWEQVMEGEWIENGEI